MYKILGNSGLLLVSFLPVLLLNLRLEFFRKMIATNTVCRIMDNRSSLIPICLILTSGASLRASLPMLEEKPSSPILSSSLVKSSFTLDSLDCLIVDDLSITLRCTFINIVDTDVVRLCARAATSIC